MARVRLFALVAFVIAAAFPVRAETTRHSVVMDGLEREFYLTIPDNLKRPAPLVVALHGLLENGESMRLRVTRGRMDVFAERYGFVVVYPSAWGLVWNLGEGVEARQIRPMRDDLTFLEHTIAEARARAPIDRDRIFVAGYSMGGMVGLSLACKRPGLVRAIAIVASGLPEMFKDDCQAHSPEGVLIINGNDDAVIPFDGGPVISGLIPQLRMVPYRDTVNFFRRSHGCTGPAQVKSWDAKDDRTEVTREAWYNCRRGAVEGYSVDGGGHRWPSGGPILPVTGRTTREIEGVAAVWGFFSRFK